MFAKLPIIDVNQIDDEIYFILKDFAYGTDGSQECGYSFIVNTSYIKSYLDDLIDGKKDKIQQIYESIKDYQFFLVKCDGDDFDLL